MAADFFMSLDIGLWFMDMLHVRIASLPILSTIKAEIQ